jgi:hypothetical protein
MTHGPRLTLPAALLLALTACGGSGTNTSASGNPTMRPGEDCLGCHSEFTAAGTVYASSDATQGLEGVQVKIYGMSQDVTMTSNSVGNFYTTVSFGYGSGAFVHVGSQQMATPLTSRSIAGCNSCHVAANRVH